MGRGVVICVVYLEEEISCLKTKEEDPVSTQSGETTQTVLSGE